MGRKDITWQNRTGGYIETVSPTGYDVLINGTNKYLNFNIISGETGYGIRDNGGTMQFKNSGGSWTNFGAGGGGAVDSVNGYTGVVVLSTADIADSLNKRYVTDAQLTVIGNTSGTNTGDNAVNTLYSGLVSNATHTGDATGATALTVVKIQGKDFPTLGAGDDQKYPKYVHASNAFVMTAIAGGGDMVLADVQTNSGAKTFLNNTILFRNPANTFSYTLTAGAIVADRTLNLPVTTGTDTLAVLGLAQTFTGVQSFTSPDTTTSITTSSVSFTAWAGATTLLTIGGTGASASMFMPSTLDTSSSTTGAIRTSGGISSAKGIWAGTFVVVGTQIELGHATQNTLTASAGIMSIEGVAIPTISSTHTLTNKRITKRTSTEASSATPTINTDNVDFHSITALAVAITSFTTNLSGTPTTGQLLWIAITDNGTARAITWGASFQASGTIALPTTTVISTRLDVGFIWTGSIWRCIATA
jgi:hypothetical protein